MSIETLVCGWINHEQLLK